MGTRAVLVSACLLGVNSRYDGGAAEDTALMAIIKKLGPTLVIPVCPEQLGGLPTPRAEAEIVVDDKQEDDDGDGDGPAVLAGKARVIDSGGVDVTENFLRGAKEVLKIAEFSGALVMYSKEGSPSCGVDKPGVTTAMLQEADVKVTGR